MECPGPTLDFENRVPYDRYVHASTLHSLQQPVTADPGEMSFLMISQVMELYFGLIRYELAETQRRLREDAVWEALAPLRRAALHLEGLNAAWHGLRWMTPVDFNRFREKLGDASGFQSAMYRRLEFMLGLKRASLARPFRRQPEVHRGLQEALAAPSLWDDVIAALGRRGFPVPAATDRDAADRATDPQERAPDPAVEAAWVEIYRDPAPDNPLRLLGEALTDVADQFGQWRERHLAVVRRTIGGRSGSGGSAGITWLQDSLGRVVFPELWSARTSM